MCAAILAAVVPAIRAASDARVGETQLGRFEQAVRREDAQGAREHLRAARFSFERAATRLDSPLTLPARAVPVLGRQIRAAHGLARAGVHVTDAGEGVVGALEARPPQGWRMQAGRVDTGALARAGRAIREGLPAAERALAEVERIPQRWLAGPLDRGRERALERIRGAETGARRAAAGLEAAPRLLGAGGTRRYLVLVANLGELRGTGGFYGHFSVLEATDGKLSLEEEAGRPTRDLPSPLEVTLDVPEWYRQAHARYGALDRWQNINTTVDFPTAGSVAVALASHELGPLDGAVQIDPPGLEALLRLTGPVEVEGWPEPISAENVSRVTQLESEVEFADSSPRRREFLAALVRTVFGRLLSADLPLRPRNLEVLADRVRQGHIQMYAGSPDDQDVMVATGLAHGVDRAAGAPDVLGLATLNGTGNKADWFLQRHIGYRARLDPASGEVRAHTAITVANTMPAEGDIPRRIGGSVMPDVPPGSNRQLVLMLRPPSDVFEAATSAGQDVSVSRDLEGKLRAYHTSVTVAAGNREGVELSSVVPDALEGRGRHRTYRLHVLRQPVAQPDTIDVEVDVPRGWKASGETSYVGLLTEDLVLEVEITQSVRAWAFEWGILRPLRLALDLIAGLFGR